MRKHHPLLVVARWTDARDTNVICKLTDVGQNVDLARNRRTSGYLTYLGPDYLVLSHDYDEEDEECGNHTALPYSWLLEIRTVKGKVIYTR